MDECLIACHICGKFVKPNSIGIHVKKCKRKWELEQTGLPPDQIKPCPSFPGDYEEIVELAKQMNKNAQNNPLEHDDDYASELKVTEYNERVLQAFEQPEIVRTSLGLGNPEDDAGEQRKDSLQFPSTTLRKESRGASFKRGTDSVDDISNMIRQMMEQEKREKEQQDTPTKTASQSVPEKKDQDQIEKPSSQAKSGPKPQPNVEVEAQIQDKNEEQTPVAQMERLEKVEEVGEQPSAQKESTPQVKVQNIVSSEAAEPQQRSDDVFMTPSTKNKDSVQQSDLNPDSQQKMESEAKLRDVGQIIDKEADGRQDPGAKEQKNAQPAAKDFFSNLDEADNIRSREAIYQRGKQEHPHAQESENAIADTNQPQPNNDEGEFEEMGRSRAGTEPAELIQPSVEEEAAKVQNDPEKEKESKPSSAFDQILAQEEDSLAKDQLLIQKLKSDVDVQGHEELVRVPDVGSKEAKQASQVEEKEAVSVEKFQLQEAKIEDRSSSPRSSAAPQAAERVLESSKPAEVPAPLPPNVTEPVVPQPPATDPSDPPKPPPTLTTTQDPQQSPQLAHQPVPTTTQTLTTSEQQAMPPQTSAPEELQSAKKPEQQKAKDKSSIQRIFDEDDPADQSQLLLQNKMQAAMLQLDQELNGQEQDEDDPFGKIGKRKGSGNYEKMEASGEGKAKGREGKIKDAAGEVEKTVERGGGDDADGVLKEDKEDKEAAAVKDGDPVGKDERKVSENNVDNFDEDDEDGDAVGGAQTKPPNVGQPFKLGEDETQKPSERKQGHEVPSIQEKIKEEDPNVKVGGNKEAEDNPEDDTYKQVEVEFLEDEDDMVFDVAPKEAHDQEINNGEPEIEDLDEQEWAKFSKEVFDLINKTRKDPRWFTTYLKKVMKRFQGNILCSHSDQEILAFEKRARPDEELSVTRVETVEGAKAYQDAITALEKQRALPQLRWSDILSSACKDHVQDIGASGAVSSQGSDGSLPDQRVLRYGSVGATWADSLICGVKSPHEALAKLIVCDGQRNRAFRKAIFNSSFKYCGVAYSVHASQDNVLQVFYANQVGKQKKSQSIVEPSNENNLLKPAAPNLKMVKGKNGVTTVVRTSFGMAGSKSKPAAEGQGMERAYSMSVLNPSTNPTSLAAKKPAFTAKKPRVSLREQQSSAYQTAQKHARTKSHNFSLSNTQSTKDLKVPALDLSSLNNDSKEKQNTVAQPLSERKPALGHRFTRSKRNTIAQGLEPPGAGGGLTQPKVSSFRQRKSTVAQPPGGAAGQPDGSQSARSAASSTSMRRVGSTFGSTYKPNINRAQPSTLSKSSTQRRLTTSRAAAKESQDGPQTARDSSTSIKRVPQAADTGESSTDNQNLPSYMRPTKLSTRRKSTVSGGDDFASGARRTSSGMYGSVVEKSDAEKKIGQKFSQRVSRMFNRTKKTTDPPEVPQRGSKSFVGPEGLGKLPNYLQPTKTTAARATSKKEGGENNPAANNGDTSLRSDRGNKLGAATKPSSLFSRKKSVASNLSSTQKKPLTAGTTATKSTAASSTSTAPNANNKSTIKKNMASRITSLIKSDPVKVGAKKSEPSPAAVVEKDGGEVKEVDGEGGPQNEPDLQRPVPDDQNKVEEEKEGE